MRDLTWTCRDCGSSEPIFLHYMVYDYLWHQIATTRADVICLMCAGRRLGRDLNSGDFIAAPINTNIAERLSLLGRPSQDADVTQQRQALYADRSSAFWRSHASTRRG